MHVNEGAGGPGKSGITLRQALLTFVLGIILVLAAYFFSSSEEKNEQQDERPAPAKVGPAKTREEVNELQLSATSVGGDWQPTPSQPWRSFVACDEYPYSPSEIITSFGRTPQISECNLAANLATKTPIISRAYSLMMQLGGHTNPARIARKCELLVLPMLDEWSYLANLPGFDHGSVKQFIDLALRCQVAVRQLPKPDTRPGAAVIASAEFLKLAEN